MHRNVLKHTTIVVEYGVAVLILRIKEYSLEYSQREGFAVIG